MLEHVLSRVNNLFKMFKNKSISSREAAKRLRIASVSLALQTHPLLIPSAMELNYLTIWVRQEFLMT